MLIISTFDELLSSRMYQLLVTWSGGIGQHLPLRRVGDSTIIRLPQLVPICNLETGLDCPLIGN